MTTRPLAEVDTECYPDYWLFKLYDSATGQFHSHGMWPGQPLDRQAIANLLGHFTIVTFNGKRYDDLMIALALTGADCAMMKEANDDIIVRNMPPWTFVEQWGCPIPEYMDSIDIMEVAPGVRIGLKMYMGRLHAPTIQDLPYDPDTKLDGMGRFVIADYCGNDLVGTHLLRKEVWDRIKLRMAIGERYNIDVRSKSDAQIAEAVIKMQLDFVPQKRHIPHGYGFHYQPPSYLTYITPQMRELLQVVCNAPFVVTDKEEALILHGDATGIRTGVNIPDVLKGRDIVIGQGVYRMGIGGLHSQEQATTYHTIPGVQKLRDVDVKSYYPSLILSMNMVPEQLGQAFSVIYRNIYDRRLSSKAEAQRIYKLYDGMGAQELKDEADAAQTESDGLKIVLNGTFGKLFSKYSVLYAPELGIRTTITGQLALLMLIEMMEASGIRVVSANTDGIVLLIPEGLDHVADQVVQWWEQRTGLEMEASDYRSIHQRDVNNYIAITTEGKVKRKGVFGQGGVLSGPAGKGPAMDICADAVVAYLKDGVPLEETIHECRDIRKFIVLRGVSGGGTYIPPNLPGYDSAYLGKAVRWHYGRDRSAYIADKKGGRVAGSLGAVPCMTLPDTLPQDIDYHRYIQEAFEMLASTGHRVRYWHDPESDRVFIDHADAGAHDHAEEIDRKTYDKRK